jgi:plastocyanin
MGAARLAAIALLSAAAGWAAAQPPVVGIQRMQFMPPTLTVKVGTTVRWMNNEKRTSHSVRFLQGSGLESERMLPGESWERRFDAAGIYLYQCGPHPEMQGTIVVEE